MARQQLIVDTKTPASCVVHADYTVSYTPSSGGWIQKGGDIESLNANDYLGFSVSSNSDGSVVAIGAPRSIASSSVSASTAGTVRVYAWNGTDWEQRGGDIGGEKTGDQSGYSVSLSDDGNTVAIGAKWNGESGILSGSQDYFGDGGSQSRTGHVRIYKYRTITEAQYNAYNTSDTVQAQYIVGGATLPIPIIITGGLSWSASRKFWVQNCADIEGEDYNDKSGHSVSLSGDGSTVAIGAIQADSRGHVRVYATGGSSGIWADGTSYIMPPTQKGGEATYWSLHADIDGEDFANSSGYSVSLSSDGNVLAVGAPYNHGGGVSDSGHVRIYRFKAITYSQFQAGNTADMTGSPGVPVIITGGKETWSGSYDEMHEHWVQEGNDIDGDEVNENSGASVSLSDDGSVVAIGSANNDANGVDSGRVRVYEYSSGSWSQKGTDIKGESAGDHFGGSVSLSDDGKVVAVSSKLNDDGGSNAGHVRVYEYKTITETEYNNGNTANTTGAAGVPIIITGGASWGESTNFWVQRGDDIDGSAANDLSGYSVSLSSDGEVVVIGAPYSDSTANNAGYVRIYKAGSLIFPQVGDWAVAEHKETETEQLLSTYTYRVTHVTDADTLVLEYVTSTGSEWGDISEGVYSDRSLELVVTNSQPLGLTFSTDGTKMYIANGDQNKIDQYDLAVAWDVQSGSNSGTYRSVGSEITLPTSVRFSSDGTRMFVYGNDASGVDDYRIVQYNLSTPWDITVGTAISHMTALGPPQDIAFSSDGTKVYIIQFSNSTIYQYNLTHPWTIQPSVYSGNSLNVSSQDSVPRGLTFSYDGTKLYIVGSNDTIYQYNLTVAWDISSGSYSGYSMLVGLQEGSPQGLAFSPDGTKTYIVGPVEDTVYQYTLPEVYSDASPCDLCDGTGSLGACGGIAPHVIKRDLGGMFMLLMD